MADRINAWKTMPEGREKYAAYLCSPEWWRVRELVMDRAGGTCEKCLGSEATSVHHLTYIRKYQECLEDLMAVCEVCHGEIHGKPQPIPLVESQRPPEIESRDIKEGWTDPQRWDWKRIEVLELILLCPSFFELITTRVSKDWFDCQTSAEVYRIFCCLYESGESCDLDNALGLTDDPAMHDVLFSLDDLAQEKAARASLSVEARMTNVLAWFYDEEVKAIQRQMRARLAEKNIDEDQELADLEALIQMEQQRQGLPKF